MNIANFIEWFIQSFITIASYMVQKLDEIYIASNVTLLDFTITITIIGIFISIVLTLPQNANRYAGRYEAKQKAKERSKKKK